MKFNIYRTSYELVDDAPIEGAVLETSNDTIGCYSAEDLEQHYTIEVETLEDLIALMERAGSPIIISKDYDKRLSIEIYDDYRE